MNIEDIVLGTILLDNTVTDKAIENITGDMFLSPRNRKIFEAIKKCYDKNIKVDIVTVINELKKIDKTITVSDLSNLTSLVFSSLHFDEHIQILKNEYVKRSIINTCNKAILNIETSDPDEIIGLIDKELTELIKVTKGDTIKDTSVIVNELLDEIKNIKAIEGNVVGLPSGIHSLDKKTTGFHKSDLIIIAARPSMGKTSFALTIASNMAVNFSKNIVFFSLEMSAEQLLMRVGSILSGVPLHNIRTGSMTPDEYEKFENKLGEIARQTFIIDDTPYMNINELKSKCRYLKKQNDIDIIFIDYLQLLKGNNKFSREQEVSEISRTLKGIAKELNVPVIALSQLNRAVENRVDKKPTLADLRESGAIEQDADLVMFLYRPEKYGIMLDEEGKPLDGSTDVLIEKHRNGAIGTVRIHFNQITTKFDEFSLF